MHILEGVAALLAAIGLYVWASGLHHRQTAPRWARGQLFASGIGLLLVCIAPAAAGLITFGLGEPMTSASWVGVVGLALAPVALWAGTRG
ncbi:hypothetical protein [Antarctobacter sp.]|uniref:hypothetical protein n=1 Tax=Antarctobacter sp. TaxID=1872577 RepID=UPI002B267E98|nr:hypothetical protein [Antarctobacter sp.]